MNPKKHSATVPRPCPSLFVQPHPSHVQLRRPESLTLTDASMSECQALLGEVHAALEKNGESYVRQCGGLAHNIRTAIPNIPMKKNNMLIGENPMEATTRSMNSYEYRRVYGYDMYDSKFKSQKGHI